MYKLYMGLDVGSVTTKGVIIDNYDNIITSSYMYTDGNPIKAVKKVISNMKMEIDLDKYVVVSVGITGSARKLVGALLEADTIKNEIMASSVGVMRMYPDAKTIIEIGGHDSKIILLKDKMVYDYAINSNCLSGTGAFIDTLSNRLNIDISSISSLALKGNNDIDISYRCALLAENNLINKIQNGYAKEDVIASVCKNITHAYVNNVLKGKKIKKPIVFIGGVSKNIAIQKELEKILGEKIIVSKNSHLMGALGIAVMARDSGYEKEFNFDIDSYNIETKLTNCNNCASNCEMIAIYRNNTLIDHWGNKCDKETIPAK